MDGFVVVICRFERRFNSFHQRFASPHLCELRRVEGHIECGQEWMGHRDYKTTEIYADYAPDPVQGARWAEAAFAEEEDDEDGDAADDEKEAS
jgi:hypothetical protein